MIVKLSMTFLLHFALISGSDPLIVKMRLRKMLSTVNNIHLTILYRQTSSDFFWEKALLIDYQSVHENWEMDVSAELWY
jgi:hypothetical protein